MGRHVVSLSQKQNGSQLALSLHASSCMANCQQASTASAATFVASCQSIVFGQLRHLLRFPV
jgi:predicted metal-binding protein